MLLDPIREEIAEAPSSRKCQAGCACADLFGGGLGHGRAHLRRVQQLILAVLRQVREGLQAGELACLLHRRAPPDPTDTRWRVRGKVWVTDVTVSWRA